MVKTSEQRRIERAERHTKLVEEVTAAAPEGRAVVPIYKDGVLTRFRVRPHNNKEAASGTAAD